MPSALARRFVAQLTQKKTKLEFKTLDCTMSTPNAETGQKTAVTYRCADIDKMVPSLMGVSKVGSWKVGCMAAGPGQHRKRQLAC